MRKWEPSPYDTTAIAAFRWFANTIENDALELYATDRRHFEQIEEVLRHTLRRLAEIRKNAMVSEEEDGCPDGWVLCDGICKPSCDGIEVAARSESSRAK